MTIDIGPGDRKRIENLAQYLKNAENDRSLLIRLSDDPIAVLQEMDISVEDEFKEAVSAQLQMMKETGPDAPHANEVKLMSARVHE